jgi:EAL domain-containing protein (putative c-di-GMP-specific phosphodiesterase class I)
LVGGGIKSQVARASRGRSLLVWMRRLRNGVAHDLTGGPRAQARRILSASQLIVVLAALALGMTFLGGATGYGLARQGDERLWSEQRTSLRNATAEFRKLFGKSNQIDPRFVRMVEQSVGLKNLKFETDPGPSEREMQPVMDGQGRIAGFLTWDKAHPMMRTMLRLMPFLAGIAIVLVSFAGLSLWQLRRARLALRATGEKGSGIVTAFEHAIDALSKDQQFIRRELPRAVAAEALELHYQPIVAADGSGIVGVEALLRWTHPERGAIGPAAFIPVAEQMGLIDRLGAFVLRRALHEAKRWPDLYVSVNLSPLQVRGPGIVDLVRGVLAETGVPPSRLILEITEGVLIDNPEEMVRRMKDLHALGVRLALDDFGSGYSSLGYLQRFPFDKLKIDRSFVTALGNSANGGVIIQAVVALGRALGLKVVVEGVETEKQRVLLRLAGCDEMQGYLFARPAPAKAIDRLLAGRSKRDREPLTA